MKITFKLNKEQAEAFKKFAEIKPDTNPDGSPFTDEEFYRHIFFVGVRALNEELRQMFEANKELLEKQKAAALASQEEKPNQ